MGVDWGEYIPLPLGTPWRPLNGSLLGGWQLGWGLDWLGVGILPSDFARDAGMADGDFAGKVAVDVLEASASPAFGKAELENGLFPLLADKDGNLTEVINELGRSCPGVSEVGNGLPLLVLGGAGFGGVVHRY